jgi:hypothetical protein
MLLGAEYDIRIEPAYLVLGLVTLLVVGGFVFYALREKR